MIIDQLMHNVMGQLRIKQPFLLFKQKFYFQYLLKVRIHPNQNANWKQYIISNALKSKSHQLFCSPTPFPFSILPSSSFSFYPNSLRGPYLFPPTHYSSLVQILEIPVGGLFPWILTILFFNLKVILSHKKINRPIVLRIFCLLLDVIYLKS